MTDIALKWNTEEGVADLEIRRPVMFLLGLEGHAGTGLSPDTGSTDGGTIVTVNGGNFMEGATVTFGGDAATVITVTPNWISVATPAHATGAVDVTVTNPDGQRSTLPDSFTYEVSAGFWHLGTGLPTTYGISDVTYDPVSGNFIAVGRDSLTAFPGNGVILTSPDHGHSWVDRTAANSALLSGFNVTAVLAGGSKIVAVANDGTGSFPNNSKILVSTDGGATWAAATIPATPLGGTWGLSTVAYNGTTWFVQRGDNGSGKNFTMTSADTVTWTAHTINSGGISPGGAYVLAQGSTFVAVVSTGSSPTPVLSCTDAVTWAELDSTVLADNEFNGNKQLASDGSILMAVGANNGFSLGVNATSPDLGATWILGNIPTIDTWGPTVYDGTIWIATGSNNGATVTTPDRSTWTTQVASGTVVYLGVASDGAGHTVAIGFDFISNLAVAVYH